MAMGIRKYGPGPEIWLALFCNAALLTIFLAIPAAPPPVQPVEIAVDVVDFTPPEPPPELEIPPEVSEVLTAAAPTAAGNAAAEADTIAAAADRMVPDLQLPAPPQHSIAQLRSEVDDILHEMNFYGVGDAGSTYGQGTSKPAGLHIGMSFDVRRNTARRAQSLQRFGGDAASEGAVERALAWLAKRQNANGSWGGAASFETGDAAALTALALLTFLAHGESFDSPAYAANVRSAVNWLSEIAAMPNIEYAGNGFGHAMLTFALAEAHAATGSPTIRETVEKRISFMLERQNKLGSFSPGYDNAPQSAPPDPNSENPAVRELMLGEPACDLSLLGWHIQALTAARNAGILPDKITPALNAASGALVHIHQAAKGGFSQGINLQRFPENPNLTPVGLLALQLLNAGNSETARTARKLVLAAGEPQWNSGGQFPLYRWYYQTQALFQAEGGAGRRWEQWNSNLKKQLLPQQRSDGSWSAPPGESGFQLRDEADLQLYATALCTLMLEVYYRYLPSYSIAEADHIRSAAADELDMTYAGLLAPLPQGSDPMAGLILGIGVTTMPPVRFGIFNGLPAAPDDAAIAGEFPVYTTLASSIPVRQAQDWPQLLQPKQRIAIFCDDLLPENFKGHLRLTLAVLAAGPELYSEAIEAVINGKRVYCAVLPCRENLIEILVPALYLQSFGNVLQIRNIGAAPLAFDAAELGAFSELGAPLYLGAADFAAVPPEVRRCFNLSALEVDATLTQARLKEAIVAARLAKVPLLLRIAATLPEADFEWLLVHCASGEYIWEFCGDDPEIALRRREKLSAALPEAPVVATVRLDAESGRLQTLPFRRSQGEYEPAAELWSQMAATGQERLGNESLEYYLRLSGRQVADWIASGGTAIFFSELLRGGRFFDSLLHTEQPAAAALKQYAKLFEGEPRRLPLAIFPRYGDHPQWETSAAAACNAPGNVTIIIAKKFPTPVETELMTLVPWDGATEVTIERGVLPPGSPFAGVAMPLQVRKETVMVENNVFRLTGIWPELTVLRLRRVGASPVVGRHIPDRLRVTPLKVEKSACQVAAAFIPEPERRHPLREANGFFAIAGTKAACQVIPATEVHLGQYPFRPGEPESVEITLQLEPAGYDAGDSVFLSTGTGPEDATVLTFNIFPRLRSDAPDGMTQVPLRLAFSGRCYQTVLTVGRWQSVSLPLDAAGELPYWDAIRILPPEQTALGRQATSVAYEINAIAVLQPRREAAR